MLYPPYHIFYMGYTFLQFHLEHLVAVLNEFGDMGYHDDLKVQLVTQFLDDLGELPHKVAADEFSWLV